ncbi:hypothetical protein [Paenibacillus sp. USDA918EY]|uniref:Uncharacterized protein n=1 Tax=Paenibacillus albilobatus TaxID=2716884 RepID=A0A920CB31_9BACL|nr:hypothetical protein [Paenibacillus sp. USDA918EY]GIO30057.1 hypothetical protein J2TS6_11980 [Paenibacillus albilobatus]
MDEQLLSPSKMDSDPAVELLAADSENSRAACARNYDEFARAQGDPSGDDPYAAYQPDGLASAKTDYAILCNTSIFHL